MLAKHHEHTEECGHIPRRADVYPAEKCGLVEDELILCLDSKVSLLARHFGINEDKLEQEKRQMLEELRK